jgi:hypothetical protein
VPNLLFWNLQKVNSHANPVKLQQMQTNCRTYFGPGNPCVYPDVCAFTEVSLAHWNTALPDIGRAIYQAPNPQPVGTHYDFRYNGMDPNLPSPYSTEKATEFYGYLRLVAGAMNSTATLDNVGIPRLRYEPQYTNPSTNSIETMHGIRKLSVYQFAADPFPHTQTTVFAHHPSPTNALYAFRTLILGMHERGFHTQRVIVAGDFNIRPWEEIPDTGRQTATQLANANGFSVVQPAVAPAPGCGCGWIPGVVHTHRDGLIDWALHSNGVVVNACTILPKIDPDSDHHPLFLSFT